MSSDGEVSIHTTAGALQIGSLLAVFLFGILTFQTYSYRQKFKDDRWQFKCMVGAIWILELAHTICAAYEVYKATVTLYGQHKKLVVFPLLGVATALGGAITFLTHCFFSLRLWKVLPRPWSYLGAFCIVFAAGRFVGSIYLGVQGTIATHIAVYRVSWRWLIITLLVVGVVLDVIIAASMLFYLIRKRQNDINTFALMIDRLVQYAIRSGLLTSICALAVLITFQALDTTLIWLAIYICLAKVYSNSLLSALNERASLRATISQPTSFELGSRQNRSSRRGNTGNTRDSSLIFVSVDVKDPVILDNEHHLIREEPLYPKTSNAF